MKRLLLVLICLYAYGALGQNEKYYDSLHHIEWLKSVHDDSLKDIQDSIHESHLSIKQGELKEKEEAKNANHDSQLREEARQAFWKTHNNTDGEEAWIKAYIRQKVSEEYWATERNTLIKKYGSVIGNRIADQQVWVGMTDKMCIESLTTPNEKRALYTKAGKTEVWIYEGVAGGCIGDCPYLDYVITFKNHKAIAISTSN